MGEDSHLTDSAARSIIRAFNPGKPGSIGLCGICSRRDRCRRRWTRRACRFPAWAVAVALLKWDRERSNGAIG
nr:MAG TPA: hypothetical protein [Caudoviricetes sp.]